MTNLDVSQKAFCEAPNGDIRLLAPAGCGKTLSLLYRCLTLAKRSKNAQRFLLITFTVAARDELVTRLNEDSSFADIRDHVEVTTLNSWGYRRMKSVAFKPRLIATKDEFHFTMNNQLQPIWMQHDKVKTAIEKKSNTTPKKIMEIIDAFKSIGFDHLRHDTQDKFIGRLVELRKQGLSLRIEELIYDLTKLEVFGSKVTTKGEEVPKATDRDLYTGFYKFWLDATDHLIKSSTFTLEDQKYFAYLDEKLKVEEGKFLSGAARYDHVLVDEFQDINPLDLALIKSISDRNRATLTIVGDDDQAIFEWRGASPSYIIKPSEYFGRDFAHFALATNYRSPKNIVEMSQRLIRHNVNRVDKQIAPALTSVAEINVEMVDDLNTAMDLVLKEAESVAKDPTGQKKLAIVGRKRSQLIPYQIFFASKDLSFCAAEDLQVFLSKAFDRLLHLILIRNGALQKRTKSEITDQVLEMCNLAKRYPLNKQDRESLRKHISASNSKTLMEAIEALSQYRGTLKGPNAGGVMAIAIANAIRAYIDSTTVSQALEVMGSQFEGLQIDMGKAEDDIFFVDPPFEQLAEFAARYGDDFELFIDDIERAKEQLVYIPPFEEGEENASPDTVWKRPIHLMTALRAKGKEFDTVVLLEVNDGIWPNKNAREPSQKESERRVFYVAFTRAKRKVMMLVARRFGNKVATPSPYVEELGISLA